MDNGLKWISSLKTQIKRLRNKQILENKPIELFCLCGLTTDRFFGEIIQQTPHGKALCYESGYLEGSSSLDEFSMLDKAIMNLYQNRIVGRENILRKNIK